MTSFSDLVGWTNRIAGPRRSGPLPAVDPGGRVRFSSLVVAGDLVVVVAGTLTTATIGRTGAPAADRALVLCAGISAALLVASMWLSRAWEPGVVGQGYTEYARVGRAVVAADVVLALGGLALLVDSVRIWVFVLVPAIGGLCLGMRYVLRKWLHNRRRDGDYLLPVLAVGSEQAVADLVRRTRRDPYFGWVVTGACTPAGSGTVGDVPVLGGMDAVSTLTRAHGHRVVAVCRAADWGPSRLHRLAWQLEDTDTELAVDPGLMEIAGPRMHIAPVDGFPLLRLSRPRFTGGARLAKAATDRVLAAALLIVALPLLVGLALTVRIVDGGPVLFRQDRIGVGGRTFRMVKFRSMEVDAEARLEALSPDQSCADGPMFKLRDDPRVTGVGRFLRRYSLDELPQLLNVLGGSMSLVGPRPPLPREVETYTDDARRRLLVRPGMTGLWQVSGRSTLTWEETIRLDLRYVENWSIALDLVILWKTVGAVLRRRGAY